MTSDVFYSFMMGKVFSYCVFICQLSYKNIFPVPLWRQTTFRVIKSYLVLDYVNCITDRNETLMLKAQSSVVLVLMW